MMLIYLIGSLLLVLALALNRKKWINYGLVGLYLILLWALTIFAAFHINETDLTYFTFDALGVLLLIILSIIAVPAMIHSKIYVEQHQETGGVRAIYFVSIVGLITAIGAGYLANHIAVTWIFAEITTLSASALIYHHRNKLALEGTWKYVFIGAISITFVFIGILFLSLAIHQTGSGNLSYSSLYRNAPSINPFWSQLAFLFIFTGYTVKLGLVPMFTAGVDAKDKAPAPAAALLSSVLMNLGFVGVFRVYIVLSNSSLHHWVNLVIGIAAFLSLFVATVYMLKVKNIKRMLGYSSIEHMALVMLGVAAGGIGYYAAILHIVLHALVKSSLFFQFNQIYRVYKSKSIYQVGNYIKYNPTGALVLLFGFISATAMPPSGLFVSEFLIFRSLFQAHQLWLLLVVLILLTMIIWAFGKNVFKILFTPPVGFDDTHVPIINPIESVSQFVLLALAMYLGLNPPAEFVHLIEESLTLLPQ